MGDAVSVVEPGTVVMLKPGQWREHCCGPLAFRLWLRVERCEVESETETKVQGVSLDPDKRFSGAHRMVVTVPTQVLPQAVRSLPASG
ncbi:hypothetical protein [Phytohabitans rumicis]|uniref:Uncharacterized protein n=1 Tax=Phytohabitans rumicis TaxID=1076125 RepID=A0A6V8L827_9ACTN|nr:hypothetical protein [Phytohabitans rumicis]GFJ91700.1 hypothetical protein Prum_053420 [Phytohabitans rumicis]